MGWRRNCEFAAKFDSLIAILERATDTFIQTFSRHLDGIYDGEFHFGVDSLHKLKTESTNSVDKIRELMYGTAFPGVRDELMTWAHVVNIIVEDLAHVLYALRDREFKHYLQTDQFFRDLVHWVNESLQKTTELCHQFISKHDKSCDISSSVQLVNECKARSTDVLDLLVEQLFSTGNKSGEVIDLSWLATQTCLVSSRCLQLAHHVEILILAENE